MVKVTFTKDFSTKKKGEQGEYSPMLASQLVNIDKVAKYPKPKKEAKK